MGGLQLIWQIAALLLLGALSFTYVVPIVVKHFAKKNLVARCRGRLAITYDDGPDPKLTPALLQLFQNHGVKASFFLVGFRTVRSPAMSDALKNSGHEIGCHTHMHRNAWRILPWQGVRDVRDGYASMSRWMPPDASFRPPFGKLTGWTWLAAITRRARISWWTCDGGDTQEILGDPSSVVRQVTDAGGGVVLMHSHDRGQDRHDYGLRLTDLLLCEAKRLGWDVCTMTELLDHSPVPASSP